MNNFFKSFLPLLKKLKLKKYFLEIFLLSLATIITILSLAIYVNSVPIEKNNIESSKITPNSITSLASIFVDVSGSVKKPNLYEFSFGSRIKQVIDKAGGLSEEANVIFFNRNFNLARIVVDQEKIYVPSNIEISDGIFVQNQQILDYSSPSTNTGDVNIVPTVINNQLININDATIEELDQLPGIGIVTANKIINNRPYTTLVDLVTKKVVSKSVFEKIKYLINL